MKRWITLAQSAEKVKKIRADIVDEYFAEQLEDGRWMIGLAWNRGGHSFLDNHKAQSFCGGMVRDGDTLFFKNIREAEDFINEYFDPEVKLDPTIPF